MLFSPEESLFRYSLVLYRKGNLSAADERLARLCAKYQRSEHVPEAIFWRGQIALTQRKYRLASGYFKQIAETFPSHSLRHDALCNLAYALHLQGKTEECKETLSTILRDYPTSLKASAATHARASLRFIDGEFDAAGEDFMILSRATSDKTLRDEYTYWLIESLYMAGHYEETQKLCASHSVDFESSKLAARFLYIWGFAQMRLGMDDDAVDVFKRISGSFPESQVAPAAILARSTMLFRQGRIAEASEGFADIVKRYRTSAEYCDAIVSLVSARFKVGDLDSARDWSLQAEQSCEGSDDLSSRIHYHLGLIFAAQGQVVKAGKRFDKAAQLANDDAVRAASLLGGGWCSFSQGEYKRAASLFESSVSLAQSADVRLESQFWAGQAFLKLGRPKEAGKSFQSVLSTEGAGPDISLDAHLGLGFAFFLRERWEEALKHFRVIAESNRESDDRAVSWLRMSQIAFYSARYESGVEYANNAVSLTDDDAIRCGAALIKGKCLSRLGKKDEALLLLRSLPTQFPDCDHLDDAMFAIATIRFESDEFKESASAFKSLVSSSPESPLRYKGLLGVANSFYNLGDYASAVDYYMRVVKSDAFDTDKKSAFYGLILCSQREGKLDELKTRVEKFIKQFSDAKMAGMLRALLAEELAQREQFFAAISQYNQAFYSLKKQGANETELAKVLYRVGQIMEQTGDLKGAISEYDQLILRLDENRYSRMGKLRKAHLHAQLGETKTAIALYSKLVQEYPRDVETAGVALVKQAELLWATAKKGAISLCNRAVKLFPKTAVAANAHILAAEIMIEKEQYAGARKRLQEAKEAAIDQDKKAYADYLYGETFLRQGNLKEASAALMSVRYLYPSSPYAAKSLLLAGQSLQKLGKKDEARKVFRALIRDYPDEARIRSQAEKGLKLLSAAE